MITYTLMSYRKKNCFCGYFCDYRWQKWELTDWVFKQ